MEALSALRRGAKDNPWPSGAEGALIDGQECPSCFQSFPHKEIRERHRSAKIRDAHGAFRWAFERGQGGAFGTAAAYSTLIFLMLLGYNTASSRVTRSMRGDR